MKSSEPPKVLEKNPLLMGRKPGERLPVITFEEFDEIEPVAAPGKWKHAPGMPYDDGLANAKPSPAVQLTPDEKAAVAAAFARGDRQGAADLMKQAREKRNGNAQS